MRKKQKVILGIWLALVAAAVAGLVLTRASAPVATRYSAQRAAWLKRRNLVDQKPLETARALALLPRTQEERPLVWRALHIADDSVDLAFAIAVREAAAHPAPPNEEVRKILQQLKDAQASVEADQEAIAALQGSNAKGDPQVEQEVELAQAQLALDQQDVADARQNLMRSGGDLQGMLKRLLDEHLATHNTATTVPDAPAIGGSWPLVSRLSTWKRLRDKQGRLAAAAQEASNTAAALARAHDELEEKVNQQRGANHARSAAAAIAAVQRLGEDVKSLADYNRRIQDQQELSETYREWGTVAAASQRAALRGVIVDLLAILLIGLAAFLGTAAIGRFGASLTAEKKRLRSLQIVARFGVQAVAVLLAIVIILGSPGQMTTIIGLAGAGLTVALKDFIVAFFGWFVLLGKNGIRVGDWVEINGIGGEVIEIGLLRTVLLETGAWSDAGHPTGRKVAFVNSFAVEGHYFNFSTSGQWLWDEIEVLVPAGEDPSRVLESVQELVARETEANVREAEKEWQRVARSHSLQSFSAAPAISVKPTGAGVNITVRYITRAYERYELRSRLYRAVVEMLHAGRMAQTAANRGRDS